MPAATQAHPEILALMGTVPMLMVAHWTAKACATQFSTWCALAYRLISLQCSCRSNHWCK
jgi:hypothetical protein